MNIFVVIVFICKQNFDYDKILIMKLGQEVLVIRCTISVVVGDMPLSWRKTVLGHEIILLAVLFSKCTLDI